MLETITAVDASAKYVADPHTTRFSDAATRALAGVASFDFAQTCCRLV